MMRRIHKYELKPDCNLIPMPSGAELLDVKYQASTDAPQLWALVDPSLITMHRRIAVVATGQPLDESMPVKYVATFQMQHLVFHVFDVGEQPVPVRGTPLKEEP